MKLTVNIEISTQEVVDILRGGATPTRSKKEHRKYKYKRVRDSKLTVAKTQKPSKKVPSKASKKGKGYRWTKAEDQWLIDTSKERKRLGLKLGQRFYDDYRKSWGVDRSNQAIYLRLRKIIAN